MPFDLTPMIEADDEERRAKRKRALEIAREAKKHGGKSQRQDGSKRTDGRTGGETKKTKNKSAKSSARYNRSFGRTGGAYRGKIEKGSIYFIASDDGGWVAATDLQAIAIEKFFRHDTNKIVLDETNYFNFKFIGNGQSDRRYAIQDRTPPHVYREIAMLPTSTIVRQ